MSTTRGPHTRTPPEGTGAKARLMIVMGLIVWDVFDTHEDDPDKEWFREGIGEAFENGESTGEWAVFNRLNWRSKAKLRWSGEGAEAKALDALADL